MEENFANEVNCCLFISVSRPSLWGIGFVIKEYEGFIYRIKEYSERVMGLKVYHKQQTILNVYRVLASTIVRSLLLQPSMCIKLQFSQDYSMGVVKLLHLVMLNEVGEVHIFQHRLYISASEQSRMLILSNMFF